MRKGDTAAIRRSFSLRFNELLDRYDCPPIGKGRVKVVADRYGITPGAAQKWLSGETIPEIGKLVVMAQLFGVSVDKLLGIDIAPESIGGSSGLLNRYVLMQHIEKLHPVKILGAKEIFALPTFIFEVFRSTPADVSVVAVVGNAMAPTYASGSMVFVNRSTTLIDRTLDGVSVEFEPLCVVQTGDDIAVRRIIVRSGERLFACDHPSYEREPFDPSKVVAVVVGAIIPT